MFLGVLREAYTDRGCHRCRGCHCRRRHRVVGVGPFGRPAVRGLRRVSPPLATVIRPAAGRRAANAAKLRLRMTLARGEERRGEPWADFSPASAGMTVVLVSAVQPPCGKLASPVETGGRPHFARELCRESEHHCAIVLRLHRSRKRSDRRTGRGCPGRRQQ